jgi:hypothetical protein
MMKVSYSLCLIFLSVTLLQDCSRPLPPSGSVSSVKSGQSKITSPPCIVYKTRSDYSKNIPVLLSEDKTKIVSYPDVKDVYFNGELAYPTQLNDGFLLDNRGIGPNVAFLAVTYEQYSRLDKTPPATDLFNSILDKDPVLVMYQCGSRIQYKEIVIELNELISSGKITSCNKLK